MSDSLRLPALESGPMHCWQVQAGRYEDLRASCCQHANWAPLMRALGPSCQGCKWGRLSKMEIFKENEWYTENSGPGKSCSIKFWQEPEGRYEDLRACCCQLAHWGPLMRALNPSWHECKLGRLRKNGDIKGKWVIAWDFRPWQSGPMQGWHVQLGRYEDLKHSYCQHSHWAPLMRALGPSCHGCKWIRLSKWRYLRKMSYSLRLQALANLAQCSAGRYQRDVTNTRGLSFAKTPAGVPLMWALGPSFHVCKWGRLRQNGDI